MRWWSSSTSRTSRSAGPVFDTKKLAWLNGRWLRENLTDEEFADRMAAWALNREFLLPIVPLVKPRVLLLSDVVPLSAFLLSGDLNLSVESFRDKKLSLSNIAKAFSLVLAKMDELTDWNKDAIAALFKQAAADLQLKLRHLLRPFYVAISGTPSSTPLFDSMEILGRDLCRAKLRNALKLIQAEPPMPPGQR